MFIGQLQGGGRRHINYLELLARFKAMRAFHPRLMGTVVQVTMDNTAAMYYLNKQGGMHSMSLLLQSTEIWHLTSHLANSNSWQQRFQDGKSSEQMDILVAQVGVISQSLPYVNW